MTTAEIAAQRGAKTASANGIDIAYVEVGDGPPLVLLHGALASTGPAWAGSTNAHVDHLPALAKHFRVIAPDTRGSGATAHPGGPAGFDVLADDVIALIDALDLGRPLIAGFSEGGATATLVALLRPDLIGALVNHGGLDYFDAQHMPQLIEHGFRPLFGGRPGATTADPDAAERAFQELPPMAVTFTTMQADYDSAQGDGHWRTYLGQFFDRTTAGVGRTTDDFSALTMPTLLLVGDRDMFCPVEVACTAYRSLPAGELAVVPNTGHDITACVIDTMIPFLSIPTPPGA
ncbi:MAG TPA: alpha/beta hydrolase [Egibacteraceae bacterium]|nr:alpha/beta hydrolase [Egibacteraceae bacterium]